MFGTYVRGGEWLFYPFFEYYHDDDLEYAPVEFGAAGDQDYRGRYRAREGLFFVSYGLTDDLAFEFEVAAIHASFDKSAADTSAVPQHLVESGLGDVEGEIRWRWRRETAERPELFSYAEVVVPHHRDKPLIGTAGWEIKVGSGVTRGLPWGTVTARAAVEYDSSSTSPFDLGEYAVEYLEAALTAVAGARGGRRKRRRTVPHRRRAVARHAECVRASEQRVRHDIEGHRLGTRDRHRVRRTQGHTMSDLIDRRTKVLAAVFTVLGVVFFLALEIAEEPEMSALEVFVELIKVLPVVLMSVGVVLLFRLSARQREEQLTVMRDLEVARLQGQRWRTESRSLLNGLGAAIDAQFSRWNLTEAEREVALLLLKGLSVKEISTIRATSERTIRAQSASLYSKAGLTGRAALSAFFLEDLLAPIEGDSR